MPGGSSRRRAIASGSCGAGRRTMPPTLLGTGRLRPTPAGELLWTNRAAPGIGDLARQFGYRGPSNMAFLRLEETRIAPANIGLPGSRPRADRGVRGVGRAARSPGSRVPPQRPPRQPAPGTLAPVTADHARLRGALCLAGRVRLPERPSRRWRRRTSPAAPVATYSIVARDSATGEIGVAVQSHWFSVGIGGALGRGGSRGGRHAVVHRSRATGRSAST